MSIFNFISSQILGSVGQIVKQGDMFNSGVVDPLKGIVNNVSGGIWKGDGSVRFTTEMTEVVLPMLATLLVSNSSFATGIKKSHDRMMDAFKQSASMANTLNDVFSSIF